MNRAFIKMFHMLDDPIKGHVFKLSKSGTIVTFELIMPNSDLEDHQDYDDYCAVCCGWKITGLPIEGKYYETEYRQDVKDGECRQYDIPDDCVTGDEMMEIYKRLISEGYVYYFGDDDEKSSDD